ncbi:MAG: threonine--tRNA ligase [Alphaproteobacteria bacterium]|nr:threonine--tRNA ligase [Alphaproteobacteria bacterium]
MITIYLPDNNSRTLPQGSTGMDLANSISKSLAKEALVIRMNGDLKDLSEPLLDQAHVEIIMRSQPEALEVIRHDVAHLLAEAAKELYGDDLQVTIGPAIDKGFYYDFAREKPFTPEDLETLEQRMKEIVDRDEQIHREVWDRDKAVAFFKSIGEQYKAEIINDLPAGEPISLYRQGNFLDLCRGPHAPSTKRIGKAFKLLKLAGAYWRGDSKNPMLQRIYGTAWTSEQDLNDYLYQLEEAEKRDHRRLGKDMNLFHIQEEAVGSIFWHPKGWTLYKTLKNYISHKLDKAGYVEVNTPELVDRKLWEASGHWDKFGQNMFTVQTDEDKTLAVKPMNCPCHVQIFKQGSKSYRDLPLRMAEFGTCHRNEPSGALHGLMRVRRFTQDDAHIFCTPEQINAETKSFCDLLLSVYKDFGFQDVMVKFSDRPDVRAGSDAIWDKAEGALKAAIEEAGIPYSMNPGEGAFYGPKLEFVLKDTLGRDWQCGTWQVDFVLPERLDATYIGEDGEKHRPVMLHRAIFGSFERFIGVLIEHYAGKFPLWLSPTQVVVATITNAADAYAQQVLEKLKQVGIRAQIDLRNEKISYKIREHSLAKIPYIFVVGKQEAEQETVAVRIFGQDTQRVDALSVALSTIVNEAKMPDA